MKLNNAHRAAVARAWRDARAHGEDQARFCARQVPPIRPRPLRQWAKTFGAAPSDARLGSGLRLVHAALANLHLLADLLERVRLDVPPRRDSAPAGEHARRHATRDPEPPSGMPAAPDPTSLSRAAPASGASRNQQSFRSLAPPTMRGALHPRPCHPSSPSKRGRSRPAGRDSPTSCARWQRRVDGEPMAVDPHPLRVFLQGLVTGRSRTFSDELRNLARAVLGRRAGLFEVDDLLGQFLFRLVEATRRGRVGSAVALLLLSDAAIPHRQVLAESCPGPRLRKQLRPLGQGRARRGAASASGVRAHHSVPGDGLRACRKVTGISSHAVPQGGSPEFHTGYFATGP